MQAQQLVLLPAPPPSVAGGRRRHGPFDPEPRCAPADRLRGPTELLGHGLERAAAGCQPHQALVVVCAPAPRVADQPELPRPCRDARRGALRQLAGDLGTGQRAAVPVANNGVLPLGPAKTRLRVMQAKVLSVQPQRIGRAAQAARQGDQIATVAQAEANRLVLMGQVRAPGRSSPQQHAAPRANLPGRAAEELAEHRGRQTGRGSGPEQRIVRTRPAPRTARRDAQTPAASYHGVGRSLEPAGDVRNGQLLSVELAEQLVLGLAPAPGQRSPRAGWGAQPWAHSQAAWLR